MKTYPKGVSIQSALTSGDVSIQEKLDSEPNSDYNLIPTGVIITKDSAADAVEPLVFRLRGGDNQITMYLKINEIYELAVDKVFKNGSSTEDIIILGEIN